MLGIKYPILLGGMLFVGKAGLTAAVSKTGGLGILGAGAMHPDELRDEIGQIRNSTDRPFGINIPVLSPRAEALIQVALEERVGVVSTSAGDPFRFTAHLRQKGVLVIHVVPTVAHARRAEKAGVDAVVAEGVESGGFVSLEEVTTMALVPQVVDAVALPVIAAGGIADARGLVAALALGAAGVQMGTRFLATKECDLPEDYRQALLSAQDTDTVVVRGPMAGHRDLKKELLERIRNSGEGSLMAERKPPVPFEIHDASTPLNSGSRKTGRSAGQSAGLIHEILPVAEVIEGIMQEAQRLIRRIPEHLS
jgi:enoyl-[acyl-carrier protein] reductase II